MRPIQIMLPFGVFLIKSKANTQLFEEKIALCGILYHFLEISFVCITCSNLKQAWEAISSGYMCGTFTGFNFAYICRNWYFKFSLL